MARLHSLMVLAILALAGPALAEYMPIELEKVPVERLLKNLQEIVDKDPKDAKAVINLARAHAMAFSLRADELQVTKGEPNQVWLGFGHPYVPFNRVTSTSDPEKLKTAKAHLNAALKHYDDALKLTPEDLVAQLGRAWLLTQTEKKSDAIEPLRKVIEKAWETEKNARGWFGERLGIAAEASGYLIPMLDAGKDQEEIAIYKTRIDQMKRLPHGVTPIAVPLRPGLAAADLEDRSARIRFDADGTGLPQEWSWITRDAAWLVHDPQRSGRIDSGRQLFGGVTFWMFWESGYHALAALDDNHDGQLTGKELEGLALWHDANSNGVSDPGEVKSLSEYEIVALSIRSELDPNHPDRIAWSVHGVTFKDGTTRPTYDLVLHSR
ncbi:MAG TPA: hypothetical protein VG457_05895 [Planctomycetota bacterium]|nr:hypothetical protein [Planctomycetota bacterium]